MQLKIGIVGMPNVGKSTLFNALTRKKVDIANYPFCTIEPNIGVVEMPDERLEKLAALSHSAKIIPAIVEFIDIAGLVKGAAQGEGLGNKFLSHIRECDVIAHVVRVFEDNEITHISNRVDPVLDMETIEYELILKDIETVTRVLETARAEQKKKQKGAEARGEFLEMLAGELNAGHAASAYQVRADPKIQNVAGEVLGQLQLLTAKPIMYVFNCSEKQMQENWQPSPVLQTKIGSAPYAVISAKIESELGEFDPDEKKEFLESMYPVRGNASNGVGMRGSGSEELIRIGYETLRLITFFTTGEDETHAWTIPRGSLAPRAGRAIHSDFEEKFIRAEVIRWDKLLEAGSYARARELGILRTEGKEYVVQDGDVIEFRI